MPRTYQLKKRAEQQAETRRRIVEAAVELHGTVGPAQATISAIARRAGVERKTIYRHFPVPDDIFQACSAHFRAASPPPDPEAWRVVADPLDRIELALEQCYRYYRRHHRMIENVLRDREQGVPVGDGFIRHRALAKRVLLEGAPADFRTRRRLAASVDLALDFHTWLTVTRGGLGDRQAVGLLCAAVRAALEPRGVLRRQPGDDGVERALE
jgi:AcrR family transcriptional regulator